MSRFSTSDGLSLAYEDAGQGPAVLCLPGLTRNARDFDDFAAAIGPGQRLIRLTYRGRGASDWDDNHLNYAVPVEARDVVELLNHLGLEKAVIVGTSRGGLIAMLMAATVKDRLAGVLLNDIGPELGTAGLETIMGYVGRRPGGQTYDAVAEALAVTNEAAFPDVPLARWRVCAERWFVEEDQGVDLRYDPRLRQAMLAGAEGPPVDMWPLFEALAGLPLALVRGANSTLLTRETVARMAERRPDMIVAEVPNRGHVPFLDEPEVVAAYRGLMERVG